MFERFTDKARRAVVLAADEARLLGHDHIGTEHILLGILNEGAGIAASALTSLGITLEAARIQVAATARSGAAPPEHIPFTAQAKRSLELALREALQLGYDYIGTEHILLGLIHDDKASGAQTLAGLGADLSAVRQRVIELLPRHRNPPRASMRGGQRLRLGQESDTAARLDALTLRLAAVERWIGIRPDATDLDAEISRVRREKEAAIDSHDFRRAEELSDTETGLLVDRDARLREWTSRPSLAAEMAELRAEVERLRSPLRAQGAEPDAGDGGAAGGGGPA
jgi:Clp amino terminal domain, pathogenicity island component